MKSIPSFLGLWLFSASLLFAQPYLVNDINPGPGSGSVEYLTPFQGMLYFRAHNAASNQDVLYKSDGTAAGTELVKDVPLQVEYPDNQFTILNGHFFFTAYTPASGSELWVSDGTTAGTFMLKDIVPGSDGSTPQYLTLAGNQIYFQAFTASFDLELWKTDGTPAGTVKITDIEPAESNKPPGFTYANGFLFFRSYTNAHGEELWRSDGTAVGTFMVKDINPGGNGLNDQSDITAFKDKVYFSATNGISGEELWKSDGTAGGTVLVKDLEPGGASNPKSFTPAGDWLYFTTFAYVGNEVKLYKTDATAAGTKLLLSLPGGTLGHPVANGDTIYFAVSGIPDEKGLWTSDGSVGGTKRIVDLNGSFSDDPAHITPFNGWLFFTAHQPGIGDELWATSPSGKDARVVADIRPGNLSSFASNLSPFGDKLFFSAQDGNAGFELWAYDPNFDQVSGFTLVDAISKADLHLLQNDEVINLAALPHKAINIRANANLLPPNGSVVFLLNGSPFNIENVPPYALAGDNPPGNYHQWHPTVGDYKLTATPFSGPNGSGEPGIPLCIHFHVADVAFGITHFTLVDAMTDQDIMNFLPDLPGVHPTQVLDVTGLPQPHQLNIRANTYPPTGDHVDLSLDGEDYSNSELQPPYALFGDDNGDYKAWQNVLKRRMPGDHYLYAEAYKNELNADAFTFFELKYEDIKVHSFTLVDADLDVDLMPLGDGSFIDMGYLPPHLNIRVNTTPESVGSLYFSLQRTGGPFLETYEKQAPYALFGDSNGDYHPWSPILGDYELSAIPFNLPLNIYEEMRAIAGVPLSISFTVINSAAFNKTAWVSDSPGSDTGFRVFPNPGLGEFEVAFDLKVDSKVKTLVTDLSGRLLHSTLSEAPAGEFHQRLNLGNLPKGIYLLRVDYGNESQVRKIVKEG